MAAPGRTPAEEKLAGIVARLLGTAGVGADDDFFALGGADGDFFGLGGYSLLVAKMIAQVNKLFECPVPLPVFLSAPALAGLASAVGQSGPVRRPGPAPAEPDGFEDGIDIDVLSDAAAAALLAVLTGEGEGP